MATAWATYQPILMLLAFLLTTGGVLWRVSNSLGIFETKLTDVAAANLRYQEKTDAKLEKMEIQQREYQDKMITLISAMQQTLARLETGERRFLTSERQSTLCGQHQRRFDDLLAQARDRFAEDLGRLESRVRELEVGK